MRHTKRAAVMATIATLLGAPPASAQSEMAECGAGQEPAADEVLFRFDGKSYTESDLPESLQQALYDVNHQHYRRQLEVVDAAILEIELRRRAEEAGKTMAEVAAELFPPQPADDAAVAAFYEENAARIGRPLAEVEPQVRQILARRSLQERRSAFIEEVERDRPFEVAIAAPAAPVADIATAGFPSRGDDGAPVTIVEFADYQCPHCRTAAGALDRIQERFAGKVRVVYMDFPINASGISQLVAEGAVCADQQDAFWRYHDLAFERQETLGRGSPADLARALELDADAFEACLASAAPRERLQRSVNEARRLGLRATPTIFLNGRRLHLHDVEPELTSAVEAALGTAGGG